MRLPAFRFRLAVLLLAAPLLGGCEQLADVLELPNPAREAMRIDAESRAIGSACRHAGRSLEDCYALNGTAVKASVFAGWRDMNDYMMEHQLDTVPSRIAPSSPAAASAAAVPLPRPVHAPLAGR